MSCQEALRELLRVIEEGGEVPDEARAHLRDCATCRELIAGFDAEGEPESSDRSASAAEAEVRRSHHRDVLLRFGGAFAIVFVAAAFLLTRHRPFGLGVPEILMVAVMGTVIAVLVALPILLLLAFLGRRDTSGKRRVYKRLRPGRWLSGVCLGIAEATGEPVALVRAIFVLLMWFHGAGLLAYLVCDLAMPVHPADREYLLRFRLQRALRWIREAGLPKV